ncbi:glycogen debranching N-terminal domain-containing protein [Pseudonocardia xinjiangensis]|uniref:glycogen debranching N-terminal domain-containing protein n=1 Tax=Pseudonocardia xinjiangensis TaxID=75289 RepID=UPI003D8D71D5
MRRPHAPSDRPGQATLDQLLTVLAAPAVLLSDPDGQVRPDGAQGLYVGDTRYGSRLEIGVDGADLHARSVPLDDAATARFDGELRGDRGLVRLRRERTLADGHVVDHVELHNVELPDSEASGTVDGVSLRVVVRARSDLAATAVVKSGAPLDVVVPQVGGGGARWSRNGTGAELVVEPAAGEATTVGPDAVLAWPVHLEPGERWSVRLTVGPAGGRPAGFTPAAPIPWTLPAAGAGHLDALLHRSLADLDGLMLADPHAPDGRHDRFTAAGSPWFCTLFGRDSLWTARLLLPLGTELAASTLRVLARRQGRRHDARSEEEPGKILHEVRPGGLRAGGLDLPPHYYGTIDATSLWCCLLHDAWRAGMAEDEVAALLPNLESALAWIARTAGPTGFLTYRGSSGGGLANQGWKDSAGGVRWADGSIAERPLALCEVQGYAYSAAWGGAAVLEAFGHGGAREWLRWADELAVRFRSAFWIDDPAGAYPAIALDAGGRAVTGPASNMGHLLSTGLLTAAEADLVADRLARPDLDGGRGLRTLSSTSAGFDPLTYHCGSVWPHDTAVAVLGLAGVGRHDVARSLGEGLVAAAAEFDDRLPELYAEVDGETSSYPTACRPQAWAAAGAVAVVGYLSGWPLPEWTRGA